MIDLKNPQVRRSEDLRQSWARRRGQLLALIPGDAPQPRRAGSRAGHVPSPACPVPAPIQKPLFK